MMYKLLAAGLWWVPPFLGRGNLWAWAWPGLADLVLHVVQRLDGIEGETYQDDVGIRVRKRP
jgi:hypothetical protein